MKLVCFPNFAAGGLVCELLNPIDTEDLLDGITFNGNMHHSLMKIGDNGMVFRNFNEAEWHKCLTRVRGMPYRLKDMWLGTHCHPTSIPEKYFKEFEQVMAITTESRLSKYYRFLRYSWDPVIGKEFAPIKIADFVSESFESDPRCINVEFEHIVDGSWVKEMNLDYDKYLLWREINSFLYTDQAKLRKIFDSVNPDDQNS